MSKRNRFFEIFVLLLLTLGIATIGILYIRERIKKKSYKTVTNSEQNEASKYKNINYKHKRFKTNSGKENTREEKRFRYSNTNFNDNNPFAKYKHKRDRYLFKKAVLHYRHLRYRSAIKTVDDLVLNYPNSKYRVRARCYQGMAFLKLGRRNWRREYFKLAKNILIRALQDYLRNRHFSPGEFTEFVISVGETIRAVGGSNSGIDYLLKKALTLAPQGHRNDIYVQLGYISLFKKQYYVAMNYFLKSNSELSRIGMARTYVNMNRFDKAFTIYEEFIKYNRDSEYYPDVKRAYIKQSFKWGKYEYMRGNYGLTYKYLKHLTTNFPDIPEYTESLYFIAQAFYKKKAYKFARKYYGKIALSSNRRFGDVSLYKIGLSYYKEKKFKKAMQYFEMLIQNYPVSGYRKDAESYNKIILSGFTNKTKKPGEVFKKDKIKNEDENTDKKIPPPNNTMLREPE